MESESQRFLMTSLSFSISGCMLCLGRSNYFRFNHPREARKMKEAMPNHRISCEPLRLFQGMYFSVCCKDDKLECLIFKYQR